MGDRSREGVVGLGATLATLGGGALVVLATVSDREFAWWQWGLAWGGLSLGLLLLLSQAVPALEGLATLPVRRIRLSRAQKRASEALYRQRLRCTPGGHEFEEVVRNTSLGWLQYEGAVRKCPICGNVAEGFQSLGAEPLNKAAEKGRFL